MNIEIRADLRDGQIAFGDSIVALSSGRLPAGVAVVRISGPRSRFALEALAGPVPDRMAKYRKLRTPDGSVLDSGLVILFPGPGSFTGEDVAEFHIHGGKAVVAALLEVLTGFDGVRHAEPGEFTRRAFLNGKIGLVETEALADLIAAETEAQRRFAVRNAEGAQSRLYMDWRQRLIHARAMLEAEIDFSDEEDVPGSVAEEVWADVDALGAEIGRHIAGFHAAEIIRDGFDVVILGAPNAGKSSLFNALARRDAAIVTEEPGTTRDLLEVVLDLEGIKIRITDTAGLRETGGQVEKIGIERAKARAGVADLLLVLEDLQAPVDIGPVAADVPMLKIGTKWDLMDHAFAAAASRYDLAISAKTGAGLGALLEKIGSRAAQGIAGAGDIRPSRLRHVELLRDARDLLLRALDGSAAETELRAEELRLAADRLGRIVGAIDVEDLLDVIFSQFCIGK
jgi:tRNA modification GTPase